MRVALPKVRLVMRAAPPKVRPAATVLRKTRRMCVTLGRSNDAACGGHRLPQLAAVQLPGAVQVDRREDLNICFVVVCVKQFY